MSDYYINSDKGKALANSLSKAGDMAEASDGSLWKRNEDGSISVIKNGQTMTGRVGVSAPTVQTPSVNTTIPVTNTPVLDSAQQTQRSVSLEAEATGTATQEQPTLASEKAKQATQNVTAGLSQDQNVDIWDLAIQQAMKPDTQEAYAIGSAKGVLMTDKMQKAGDMAEASDGSLWKRNEDGSIAVSKGGKTYTATIDREAAQRDPQWAVLTAPPATVDESDKGKSKSTSGSYSAYSAGTGGTASGAGTAKQGTSTATMDTATRRKLIASAEKEMNDLANQIKANKARGKDTRLLEQKYALAKSNVESLKSTKPEGATIQQQPTGRNLDIAAKKQLQEQVDAYGEAYRAAQAKKEFQKAVQEFDPNPQRTAPEKMGIMKAILMQEQAGLTTTEKIADTQTRMSELSRKIQAGKNRGENTTANERYYSTLSGYVDDLREQKEKQEAALTRNTRINERKRSEQRELERAMTRIANLGIADLLDKYYNAEGKTQRAYRAQLEKKGVTGQELNEWRNTLYNETGQFLGDFGTGVFQGGLLQAQSGLTGALAALEKTAGEIGVNKVAAWVIEDLMKAVPEGAFKNSMLNVAAGLRENTGESGYEADANELQQQLSQTMQAATENHSGAAKWAIEQAPSMGNMLFNAGTAGALGVSSLGTLATSAGGSAYMDAINDGASNGQALAYGIATGIMEAASEKLFGGNPLVDTDAGLVNKLVSKVTSNPTILRILDSKGFDLVSEGLEEVITEITEPWAQALIYAGKDADFATLESTANAFLGGVFMSLVGNVAALPVEIASAEAVNAAAESAYIQAMKDADAQLQKNLQEVRAKIATGEQLTAEDLGRVISAAQKADRTISPEQVAKDIIQVREVFSSKGRRGYQLMENGGAYNDKLYTDKWYSSRQQAQAVADAINSRRAKASGVSDAWDKAILQTVMGETATAQPPNASALWFTSETDSADVASQITLSQPGQTVKPDVSATGSVEAMRSQFNSQQKQSQTQSNTINATEVRNNVPEARRSPLYYDTISEKQSLYNARTRLAQDYAGEVTELRGKHNWSGEEVDMGMAILDNYRRMAEQTGDWTDYSNWRKEVQRHGTAAGQALQAYAKYSRQTGGDIVADASSALERAAKNTNKAEVMSRVNELANRYDTAIGVGKENVEVNVDDLVEIIKDASATRKTGTLVGNKLPPIVKWAMNRIANYARAEAQGGGGKNLDFLKKFAADSIYNIAADTNKASVTEKIKETRRLGMLSKVSTVMRNLVSNNVFDPIDSIARNISIPLDMLISKFTGTRSIAYDASWFSKAKRKGSLDRFAQSCMEVGLDVNASENQGRYENTTNRTFKMSGGVFSKLMSTWEAYEGYTLNATDEFQKGGIEASVQAGIDKLYEKGKIKDDSLRDAGRQEALYRTYQDKTVLSNAVIGVRNGLNKVHIGDIGLGDVVLPFAQVPSNLGARAIEYSPAGLLVSATDLINMIDSASKGEMTAAQQAKAVQGVGRALTGSAMIAIAAAGALRGWINVAGDDDDDNKEKLDETAGLNGTQLNISAALRDLRGEGAEWQAGDKLISIGFLDPINAQLTTGALIADDIQSEQLAIGRVFGNSVSGALQSVLDMPLMSVFRDIETAYKYSSGETAGERIIDTAARYAAGQVSSLVPNFLRGIAQGLDDTERDAYTSDNYWQQAVDNVKASIPGLRETLPAKTDPWGNEVKNEGGLINFINRTINPGNVTTYTPDAVSSELESISEATGESLYPDRSAPKSITVDNQKIPLSYEQKNAYKAFYGSDYYKTVQGLMKNDNYLTLPDEVKAEVLKQAESVATEQAKEMLGIGYEMQKSDRDIANMSGDDRGNALIAQAVKAVGYISHETQQQLDAVNKQYGSADYLGLSGDLFESARKRTQEFYEDVEASKYGGELSTTQQELLKKSPKEIAQHFIDNAVNAKYKNDTNGSGDRYDEILDAYKGGEVNDTVALAFLPDNTAENYRRYAGRNDVSTEMLLEAQHVKAGMSEKTDKDGKVAESVEDQFNAWLDTKTYWTANQKDGIRNSFYPDRTTIYKYLSKQMSTGKVSLNEIKKELTPTYQAGWSNNVKPAGVGMSTYIDCIVEYENRPNEEERKALNYNSGWEWYCDWLNTTDLTKDQKYAIAISARETGGEYSDKTKKKIYDRLK